MSMVHCRGCGQQIHVSAPSCPHCGAPQGLASSNAANEPLPPGVAGWSWGAFLFNWLWAVFNGVWFGLLALLPFVGIVVAVVLGIKGREMAWRAKRWDSVEHFQRTQRNWSRWGVALVVGPAVLGIACAIALPAYHAYTMRASAAAQARERVDADEARQAAQLQQQAEAVRAQAEASRAASDRQAQVQTDPAEQQTLSQVADAASQATAATAPTATPVSVVDTTPKADAPERDVLAQARACPDTAGCVGAMLSGALPRRADVVQAAATRLGDSPKPAQGDRKVARDLNRQALAQFGTRSYGSAAELLERAAATDPHDAEIKSNLGLALVKAGRAPDAVKALLSALELDPRRSSAWVPLAEAMQAQRMDAQALQALLLAYEFSPNKQTTLDYYRGRSLDADATEGERGAYAKALATVEGGY